MNKRQALESKKQIVEDSTIKLSIYDFEGTIDSVIEYLNKLRRSDAIESNIEVREYSGYDGSAEFVLVHYRYESDVERDRRLLQLKKEREKAKAAKLEKEEKERADYERLKAKFG